MYIDEERPAGIPLDVVNGLLDRLATDHSDPAGLRELAEILEQLDSGLRMLGLDAYSSQRVHDLLRTLAEQTADSDWTASYIIPQTLSALGAICAPSLLPAAVAGPADARPPRMPVDSAEEVFDEHPRSRAPLVVLVALVITSIAAGYGLTVVKDLRDARTQLAEKQIELDELTVKVADVANEKAQAQDARAAAESAAQAIAELAATAVKVNGQFERCVNYAGEWATYLKNVLRGYVYDQQEVDLFIAKMAEVCGEAKDGAATLRALIETLE